MGAHKSYSITRWLLRKRRENPHIWRYDGKWKTYVLIKLKHISTKKGDCNIRYSVTVTLTMNDVFVLMKLERKYLETHCSKIWFEKCVLLLPMTWSIEALVRSCVCVKYKLIVNSRTNNKKGWNFTLEILYHSY